MSAFWHHRPEIAEINNLTVKSLYFFKGVDTDDLGQHIWDAVGGGKGPRCVG